MRKICDKRMLKNKKLKMHVFAFLTIILWSLGYVMTRLAMQYFSTEAVSFLRYFIAAIFILIYSVIKKTSPPKWKDIPIFFIGGAIGFSIYVFAINEGSKTLTASTVSLVVSIAPIITALLAQFLLKEKMGTVGWISVLCAFWGVGITCLDSKLSFASGTIWICFAAILISLYNIYQRKLLNRYSPLEITSYCIISGAILLSIFAPQSFKQVSNVQPIGIIVILILGIFCASIAYLLWAYALSQANKTSEVTNYMFVTPILTTILGFILIGETPHFSTYIGGIFVLIGLVLINKKNTL